MGHVLRQLVLMPASRNILILYAARALRGFGDGFAIILLPVYLAALGYGPVETGFVATAALLGSAAMTLAVGGLVRRYSQQRLLFLGALIMVATGLALPAFEPLAVILLVTFLGTINPSSGDIGFLIPLEHASLAQSVAPEARTRTFAHYSLIGAMTMAAGSLAAALPETFVAFGLDRLVAIKIMFYGYAALGVIAAALYTRLPARPAAAGRIRPPCLDNRAPSSSSSRRFSASTHSRAALSFSPCSRSGCSSGSH